MALRKESFSKAGQPEFASRISELRSFGRAGGSSALNGSAFTRCHLDSELQKNFVNFESFLIF